MPSEFRDQHIEVQITSSYTPNAPIVVKHTQMCSNMIYIDQVQAVLEHDPVTTFVNISLQVCIPKKNPIVVGL